MYYTAFVDAAFLHRAGARTLGKKVGDVRLQADEVVAWARGLAEHGAGQTLLRVYWYDGEFATNDDRYPGQRRYFDAIENTVGIKLRLGYVVERTPEWHYPLRQALEKCGVDMAEFEKHFSFRHETQQKGVDALITLDLVHLAENDAYEWAVLVAGDRDFEEAVWTAQDEGKRVLVAIPEGANIAPQLKRQADDLLTIPTDALNRMLVSRADARKVRAPVVEVAKESEVKKPERKPSA